MTPPQHPAARVHKTMVRLIQECSRRQLGSTPAVQLWEIVANSKGDTTKTIEFIDAFKEDLKEWRNQTATDQSLEVRATVEGIAAKLSHAAFVTPSLRAQDLIKQLEPELSAVLLSSVQQQPLHVWDEVTLQTLVEDAKRWKEALASYSNDDLPEWHRQRIIYAIDELMRTIETRSQRGDDNITSALLNIAGLLRLVAPATKLTQVVLDVLPSVAKIPLMLTEGSDPTIGVE